MAIDSGTRLGPYEILAPLGFGGMGEVYRASDTRLRREVAIKVLPASFAQDAGRLRRFEQEALATAALNHPNILAIYDVGSVEGAPYVVSELLTGRTLRDELGEASPLPRRRAVEIAKQVAHGLAAAHARGIVHRDLKPENLFVTTEGLVKILDFGLAKLIEAGPATAGATTLPATAARTEAGVVLGTIGYMAPEQVRGLEADHRADLFSFGAVLYEMLAGQRAFSGATSADTMTAILKDEPSWPPASEGTVPLGLARIVMRCLEKAPERRFQSASDLAFALDALSGESGSAPAVAPGTAPPARRREQVRSLTAGAILGAIGAAVAGAAVVGLPGGGPPAGITDVIRFTIPADGLSIDRATGSASSVDISPDGRWLVFIGQTAGGRSLWVRPLDSLEARELPGTDGVQGRPFWSPDSRVVGFFAGGKLRRIDVGTGVVNTITDATTTSTTADGAWGPDGTILFSTGRQSGLLRVPPQGGQPVAQTALDESRQEAGHYLPQFLPDGRRFLYLVQSPTPEVGGVYLGSLDDEHRTRLLDTVSPFAYADSHLLFIRNRALLAQALDVKGQQLTGEATALLGVVDPGANFLGSAIAVSRTGVLVVSEAVRGDQQFVWVDRTGRELGLVGDPGQIGNFDLSPDESALTFSRQEFGASSIWRHDFARNVETRLTTPDQMDTSPVWSPDGQRIAFSRGTPVGPQVMAIQATGGEETPLTDTSSAGAQVDDWSPDGRFVTFNRDPMLMAVPVAGGEPFAFVTTAGKNVDESHFSPDGRWIAYNSNDSGTWQVYVAPFPSNKPRLQVSAGGGVDARWRRDGRELYYLSLDGRLMAVDLRLSDRVEAGAPRVLFDARVDISARIDHYAATGDGQRFLFRRPVGRGNRDPWTIVVNWLKLVSGPELTPHERR